MPAIPDPHDETPLLPEEWLDLVDETSRAPARQPSVEGDGEPSVEGDGEPSVEGDGRGERGLEARRLEALARARVHARALRSLPRLTPPLELDGLVVAALHGGHREQRAAAYVASLAARPAPSALLPRAETAIDGSARPRAASPRIRPVAPRELDRLVAARVRAEAGAGGEAGVASTRRAARSESARQRLLTATAAGVVLGLLFGVVGVMWSLRGEPAATNSGARSASAAPEGDSGSTEGVFVEFIEVDVSDLSPSDRALLSRLGGPLMGGRS